MRLRRNGLAAAPRGVGAIGVLAVDELSAGQLGEVLRTVGVVHGRADVVHAKALAVFARGNGAQVEGATDTTS